jgi:endonuclease YncB( thermonuclease family)
MNKNLFILILTLSMFGFVSEGQAQCWKGIVVEVIDSNTLLVKRKQTRVRVRLYGIDAPAPGEPYASEAKNHLQDLLLNKEATVCSKKTSGGVAYEILVLKGFMKNVNRDMVGKGFARSTVDGYKNLEKSARKKHLGLWNQDTSVQQKQTTQNGAAPQKGKSQDFVHTDKEFKKPSSGGLSVYKVTRLPQPDKVTDNGTQSVDPVTAQRQAEIEALREKEQQRVSDTRLSLTDIGEFKLSANFINDWYESYAGLEISFDYWSTILDSPVDWNDGDVNCECRVTGHFSEGTNTRIAKTNDILSSYTDRVYINIPYTYFEDSFIDLNSCTVECRISAGIFDLKASDKVYLQFNYRPWYLQRPQHY